MQASNWYARPNPRKLITYGQDDNGHLIFAVRVTGLPAMPESSKVVAQRLCQLWEEAADKHFGTNRADPLNYVHVTLEAPDE